MTPREQIEWINDNASLLFATYGQRPKLTYLVSLFDCHAMQRERLPNVAVTEWFEMSTPAGYVEVRGDRTAPRGGVVQAFRCPCSALFLDDQTRSGLCETCRNTRHAAKRDAMRSASKFTLNDSTWSTVSVVMPVPPSVIRTPVGDIPMRADPILGPDEVRFEAPMPRRAATYAEYVAAMERLASRPLPERAAAPIREMVAACTSRPDGFDQHRIDEIKVAMLAVGTAKKR